MKPEAMPLLRPSLPGYVHTLLEKTEKLLNKAATTDRTIREFHSGICRVTDLIGRHILSGTITGAESDMCAAFVEYFHTDKISESSPYYRWGDVLDDFRGYGG